MRVYDVTEGLSLEEGLLYEAPDDILGGHVSWDYVVDYVQAGRDYEIRYGINIIYIELVSKNGNLRALWT